MKFRVRSGFHVHLSEDKVAEPGTVLDLTEEEFQRYAHQLEPIVEPKQESKDGKSKVQS